MKAYEINKLRADLTTILPCRKGDLFVWLRDKSDMFSAKTSYDILDVCVMTDGTSVTITNRVEDLPNHVYIAPNEIGGVKNLEIMVKKLNSGYQKNEQQVYIDEIPSYWRIKPGDYLIWAGESRADQPGKDGVLKIYSFDYGFLLINEPTFGGIDKEVENDLVNEHLTQERAFLLNKAVEFIVGQGKARILTESWSLG